MPRLRTPATPTCRGLVLLASLLLCSSLGACRAPQGYPGERRPEHETARLGLRYDARGTELWLERISGFSVDVAAGEDVEVLPGTCLLEGRARGFGQPSVGAPFTLDFLAVAGHDYALVLDQPMRSERLLIAVEDLGTKATVASMELWP